VNGGIATDGGVLRRQVTQEFCGPANQSGLQQVLLFWKSGFVQALGVALIPLETPAQKQALGRPRDGKRSARPRTLTKRLGVEVPHEAAAANRSGC